VDLKIRPAFLRASPDVRRCVERGSDAGGDFPKELVAEEAGLWAFASRVNRRKARRFRRCASVVPPVSMVQGPTETGGEGRTVKLPKGELVVREDAVNER
jgi:hypothetical protein